MIEENEEYEVDTRIGTADKEVEKDPRAIIAENYDKQEYGEPEPEEVEEELSGDVVEMWVDGEKKDVAVEDTVEIKVSGRERRVLKDKVDAAGGIDMYQKRVATEEGFKEMTEGRKQLNRDKEQLESQKQQLAEMQAKIDELSAKDVQKKEDLPVGDQAEAVRKYHEALFDGDDEAADKAFIQLNEGKGAEATPVDVDDIAKQAATQARKEIAADQYTKDVNSINDKFVESYPDIVDDHRLYEMARIEAKKLQAENPGMALDVVMSTAGDSIMEWSGKNVRTIDSKKDAKRAMNTPRASTGRSKAPPAPRHQTNSEYVQELRTQRGLG